MAEQHLTIESILLADYIIEATDGKKSVVGIFDKIFVRKLPTTQPKMWLYVAIRGEKEQKEKLTLSIHGPNKDQQLVNFNLEFAITATKKATLMINLEQFPLQETGEYHVHLMQGETDLGMYKFEVVKVKEEEKAVN